MATSFDTVIDLGMVTIKDYKIDALAKVDPNTLETYLDGFLLRAIPKFTNCLQPLSYDLTTREFTSTFTYIENEILACLFNIEWMTSAIQDVTQFQGKMSNSFFKQYSEAENLKQKREYLDVMREKCNQLIVDYQSTPDNLAHLWNWMG